MVDESDEEPAQPEPKPEPEPEHQGEGEEYDMERAIQMTLHTPKRRSTTDQFIFQRRTPATTEEVSTGPSAQPHDDTSANIVRDSPSLVDAKTGAESNKTISGDEDQARPDPRKSGVALAGPDLEPTHDEFTTNLYPKVQESLKFPANEHVILEDPLTSSSVPPLSTPIIDLSPPKPASSTTQAPIFIATTTTITTLPPLPQQQSTTESELAERVTSLEKKFSDLEQKNKNLDNTTRNLRSRVFTLELRDLPHKIDETVCETVKEAVQVALQAPLRDCFRYLSEEDKKEMLHQRMFKNGSYKSLLEHVALYEALEASMERAQRDEFLAKKDKLCKRRHDDQNPPPPPLDSDLSKKK
ncbi:hypothetical protein Tco_0320838 [Tanacetum coccineum]